MPGLGRAKNPEAARDALLELLAIATCCRDWPVTPLFPIGRCGYCGQRPEIKETQCQDTQATPRESNTPNTEHTG